MIDWYAVNTHARAESRAQAHLNNQGFETYLPQYSRQRRHARRIDYVRAPLFPRYLFVRLDIKVDHWTPVLSTIGVQSIVRNGTQPAAIPDGIIDEIRGRETENGLVLLNALQRFRPGDAVTLDHGPFGGRNALFDSENDENRIVVLLNIM